MHNDRQLTGQLDEGMTEIIFPPLVEDPPIVEDVVNTWEIESWRALPKREHGPMFQAGGFPWYVTSPSGACWYGRQLFLD